MLSYADTSALTKRYIGETGTDTFSELFARSEILLTSSLTELELLSVFERSKRMRRLDSPSYREVSAALERDLQERSVSLLEINVEILNVAKRLIKQRQLRAPDALQLASALIAGRGKQVEIHFLCADHTLLEAARLEGLRCHDVSR